MRWLNSITDWTDMNLSKLQDIMNEGEPRVLQSMGWQRNWDLAMHNNNKAKAISEDYHETKILHIFKKSLNHILKMDTFMVYKL